MSYHPPPQKSPYGDTDFSDDNWSQGGSSAPPPPPPSSYPTGGYGSQTTGSQSLNRMGQPANFQTNPRQNLQSMDIAQITSSMTQEDILFMRKFRRDIVFYRVIPFTALGWGSLYIVNQSRNLPHTIGKYALVGLSSMFLGIGTYRNRFREMVAENRSTTPYMQALRTSLGIQPLTDGGQLTSDQGMDYGNRIADGSTNWDSTELSGDQRFSPKPQSNFSADRDAGSYPRHDGQELDPPKQAATYEELRARNRGYAR